MDERMPFPLLTTQQLFILGTTGKLTFSSPFNTAISTKLITKLNGLDISTSMCSSKTIGLSLLSWASPCNEDMVKTPILNTGVPQGCVLSPLLLTMAVYLCVHHRQVCRWYHMMSRPTGRRFKAKQHGVLPTTSPSTPRRPESSLWTSRSGRYYHTDLHFRVSSYLRICAGAMTP